MSDWERGILVVAAVVAVFTLLKISEHLGVIAKRLSSLSETMHRIRLNDHERDF